jgi:hypothetical protein
MAGANGPKWIVGTAIAGVASVAAPVIAWTCLPVYHPPGASQIYARPVGLLSDSFELRMVNTGRDRQFFVTSGKIHQKGESVPYRCHYGEPISDVDPGESVTGQTSPGKDPFFAKLTPGLHRLTIQHDGLSGHPETDIWVLQVGGKTLAIK